MAETLKKLSETAALIYSKTIKTYTLSDVIKHRNIPFKNLYEICSSYPSNGIF
jgi:hypothetical protein